MALSADETTTPTDEPGVLYTPSDPTADMPLTGDWQWHVDEIGGVYGKLLSGAPDAVAEVWVIGRVREQRLKYALPLAFPSLDHAQRAGALLAEAFALAREERAKPDDGHEHDPTPVRLTRLQATRSICRKCHADLGEAPDA